VGEPLDPAIILGFGCASPILTLQLLCHPEDQPILKKKKKKKKKKERTKNKPHGLFLGLDLFKEI
jgi:hypothetical protein